MNGHYETLVAAAYAGDLDEIQRHLDQGADIDGMEFFICAKHGALPEGVLDGEDVRVAMKCTALMAAVLADQPEVVQFLIDNGADVDAQNECSHSAALLAAYVADDEMIDLLLDNGADADVQTENPHYERLLDTYLENEALVRLVMNNGADPRPATELLVAKFKEVVTPPQDCVCSMLRSLSPLSMVNTPSVN